MRAIAIDTETKGFRWFDDQTAFMATWSWSDEPHDHVVTIDDPDCKDKLLAVLDELQPGDAIVFHNAKFDVHQIYATWGIDLLEYTSRGIELHCTDLLARVVVPFGAGGTTRYKLKHLGNLFLGAGADEEEEHLKELAKSVGMRTLNKDGVYYQLWRAYPQAMEDYAKKDTRLTIELFAFLLERLAKHDNQRLNDIYLLERRVLPILIRAERRGVAVDPERVTALRKQYRKAALALHKTLAAELGEACLTKEVAHEEDTTMADALREALLKHGVPLHKKTDTGLLSTAKFALMEFEDQFPILSDLREWRRMMKFLATYVDPLCLDDGTVREVVHCSFNQLGAWTGRMSCRQPNMQNLPAGDPEGARSVFVPRPGYALVVADFDSIEARLLAYYLGDSAYRELVDTQDPHAWLTSLVDHGDDQHISLYLKGTAGAERRGQLKNVTYAIMYGAGGPRISDMLQISREEAKALIAKVKAHLPGFHQLNAAIRRKVQAKGYVNTALGRHQSVNPEKAYVGMSGLVQGTAADAMKEAAVLATEAYAQHPAWDAQILLVVHDELVVEVRAEHAEACLAQTIASMEFSHSFLTPPLRVSASITTENYGHSK